MKACIRLELIGDDFYFHWRRDDVPFDRWLRYLRRLGPDKSRPWVAQLLGLDKRYGFQRRFMRGTHDYTNANSVGSRGVYAYYPLGPGIYEINERYSWHRVRRYFILVNDAGQYHEITKEDAIAWLTNTTSE